MPISSSELGETSQGGAPRRRGTRGNFGRGVTSPILTSRLRTCLAASLTLGLMALMAVAVAVRLGTPNLARAEKVSVSVLDREDRLLRAFTTPDGRWRLALEAAEVDPRYLAMLIAFEDKRFREHGGVDARSLLRAGWQLVRNGRIVSGGSTLSMQVARLLDGEHERSAGTKARQMLGAWQLEHRHGKDDILRLYLRLAPFGGNVEGVRAASLAYFGKEPRRLSAAEAALLVALPQAPESRRPDRHPEAARRARDRVLARAVAAGVIKAEDAADARREPVPTRRREFPKLAPHLAEAELRKEPLRAVHRTTLDRDLQARLEPLAAEHAHKQGEKLSAALLVIDHRSGEIMAHIGSANYFDESRLGAVDMTEALRSPGSTLKPLIYALAFEAGIAHPETLIEDQPERFGLYAPKNFDHDFRGTVTLREALGDSLNIPAVKLLANVGPARLTGRLRRIGAAPVIPGNKEPTLAAALGGLGMKLTDLATLYVALARGGEAVPLTHRRETQRRDPAKKPVARRLVSPVAAWYVADILKDAPPPVSARGGRIAYKTGTSYGFRDAWATGFDGRYTIVVWMGRADATATPGLTGRTAAAPLLFDAFARLGERPVPLPSAPSGAIKAATSGLPVTLRRFKSSGEETPADGPFLEPPLAIAFPQDRMEIEVEGNDKPEVVLKAEGGALPLVWLVDGAPIDSDPMRRDVLWEPGGRGFATVTVIDAKGRTDRVAVRVK
ncbi:MAG: penicillin-binding protein 1C [Hyphomicrobiaceae bacterium]